MFKTTRIVRQAVHPYLHSVKECTSINTHERLLTFLAMNVNKGDYSSVSRDWHFVLRNIHTNTNTLEEKEKRIEEGLEVVLQTHLFTGFPRVINALAVLHELNQKDEIASSLVSKIQKSEFERVSQFEDQTLKTCKGYGLQNYNTVYAALAAKVASKMETLHPAIGTWMLTHGYGTVLQRQDLCNFRLRELCAVATLCSGPDVSPQLGSHLRGALRVGCTMEELDSVISGSHLVYGEDAQTVAYATLFSLGRSRSSL